MARKKKKQSTEEYLKSYEALIKRLEEFAERNPNGYRNRVRQLIALGYGYIFLILFLSLALLGFLVYEVLIGNAGAGVIKLGIITVLLCYAILRSLWIKFPPPESTVPLHRSEIPELFTMLDEISSRLKSPRFHHVFLTFELNASVLQRPRFGLLGGYQNYLILGLPLMLGLTPDEFKSVVAHEFGHLSEAHSKFSGYVYRVRLTWLRLIESLTQEEEGIISALFTKFFRWYAPYFNAYSFVLARADEYVADRCAVELTSREVYRNALLKLPVLDSNMDTRVWKIISDMALRRPSPPDQPFKELVPHISEPPEPADFMERIDIALRAKTEYDDTHPSLKDRLRAIGVPETDLHIEKVTYTRANISAAEYYLGAARIERFISALEREWVSNAIAEWTARYSHAQKMQKALDELESRQDPLSFDDLFHRAWIIEHLRTEDEALEAYRAVLASKPNDKAVKFHVGRLLLTHKKDPEGIAYLEKTMQIDPYSQFDACQIIYGFWMRQKNEEEAEKYRNRYLQESDTYQLAQEERWTLKTTDTFTPHEMPADVIHQLREQLEQFAMITNAYLVQKVVTLYPQRPFWVLFVEIKQPFLSDANYIPNVIAHLNQSLEMDQEIGAFASKTNSAYAKRAATVPGALIYVRSKS
jgi:Zn-dependent protease with chaperone function/Tfp pilus assembly protein PilF